MDLHLEDGKVVAYRVKLKVSFKVRERGVRGEFSEVRFLHLQQPSLILESHVPL